MGSRGTCHTFTGMGQTHQVKCAPHPINVSRCIERNAQEHDCARQLSEHQSRALRTCHMSMMYTYSVRKLATVNAAPWLPAAVVPVVPAASTSKQARSVGVAMVSWWGVRGGTTSCSPSRVADPVYFLASPSASPGQLRADDLILHFCVRHVRCMVFCAKKSYAPQQKPVQSCAREPRLPLATARTKVARL